MALASLSWAEQRQYLQAMGIPVLAARMDLPGAAARCLEIDEDISAAVDEKPAQAQPVAEPVAAASPAQPAARLADLMPSPISTKAAPAVTPHAASPAASVAPISVAQTLRFALAIVPVSATETVLLDCPPSAILDDQAVSLWESICRYYRWQPRVQTHFLWPLLGLPAASSEAAREAVNAWLSAQQAQQLIYFGDQARSVLPDCVTAPSLDAMLLSPERKREVLASLCAYAPVPR